MGTLCPGARCPDQPGTARYLDILSMQKSTLRAIAMVMQHSAVVMAGPWLTSSSVQAAYVISRVSAETLFVSQPVGSVSKPQLISAQKFWDRESLRCSLLPGEGRRLSSPSHVTVESYSRHQTLKFVHFLPQIFPVEYCFLFNHH